jgi:bifunctional DNase/RNase
MKNSRHGDIGMLVRMDLVKIIITENEDQQVIVLRERDGTRSFPIMIGIAEAVAIDRRLKGIKTARPLTHELLAQTIEQLGGQIDRIIITDLRDHTFYASLILRQNGELRDIDCRPSDAIALGVASSVPIYVEDAVIDKAAQ